jgi:hypothetical protein
MCSVIPVYPVQQESETGEDPEPVQGYLADPRLTQPGPVRLLDDHPPDVAVVFGPDRHAGIEPGLTQRHHVKVNPSRTDLSGRYGVEPTAAAESCGQFPVKPTQLVDDLRPQHQGRDAVEDRCPRGDLASGLVRSTGKAEGPGQSVAVDFNKPPVPLQHAHDHLIGVRLQSAHPVPARSGLQWLPGPGPGIGPSMSFS